MSLRSPETLILTRLGYSGFLREAIIIKKFLITLWGRENIT